MDHVSTVHCCSKTCPPLRRAAAKGGAKQDSVLTGLMKSWNCTAPNIGVVFPQCTELQDKTLHRACAWLVSFHRSSAGAWSSEYSQPSDWPDLPRGLGYAEKMAEAITSLRAWIDGRHAFCSMGLRASVSSPTQAQMCLGWGRERGGIACIADEELPGWAGRKCQW